MRRISIYNEKGGSGKTTVGILLASYLTYSCGKRVAILDFDSPTFHFSQVRDTELELMKNPRAQISLWLRNNETPAPYDIFRVPTTIAGSYDYDDIMEVILNTCDENYDYVFYDFPGRFSEEEPVALLAANGMIDFVAVPMDTDIQSRKSALIVCCALLDSGVPNIAFWNRVTRGEYEGNGNRFKRGAAPFAEYGIPVMENAIREIKTFSRDSDELLFVRSTLCFPDKYIRQRCPFMFGFLEELKGIIDNSDETLNQPEQ